MGEHSKDNNRESRDRDRRDGDRELRDRRRQPHRSESAERNARSRRETRDTRETTNRNRDRGRGHNKSSERRDRSRSPNNRSAIRREKGTTKGGKGGAVPQFLMDRPEITAKDLEGKSEEEQLMIKSMGFMGFQSTKGKAVPGNDVSAVHLVQKRKYRQYMNRKGGFNRPLDFVA